MIKEKWVTFKQELLSFSSREKSFILNAMICGFFICMDYAIIRPVSNSVFISSYTAELFPYAWLAAIPLNLTVVSLYNRYLPRWGCYKMASTTFSLVIFSNLFCAFFLKTLSFLPFIFYIWKEVYVLLMFQQLWSVIHSTVQIKRAKYLYGIFFGMGGLGGAIGSSIPGFLAVKMGSESLLFSTIPIYGLLIFFYFLLVKNSEEIQGKEGLSSLNHPDQGSMRHSVQLIIKSRFLTFILLIVVLMQISATLIDYQFHAILGKTILDKDLRTEYLGRILGIVNFSTMTLQFFGTYLILHFLGLRRSHFLVPLTLCFNAIGFLLFPLFGMISFAFATIKTYDFSLFGVIKEMLYIPLKIDEKFHAKAIIDVFAYRGAKAFASILILFFQLFKDVDIVPLLTWGSLLLFITWVWIVFKMFVPQQQSTSS